MKWWRGLKIWIVYSLYLLSLSFHLCWCEIRLKKWWRRGRLQGPLIESIRSEGQTYLYNRSWFVSWGGCERKTSSKFRQFFTESSLISSHSLQFSWCGDIVYIATRSEQDVKIEDVLDRKMCKKKWDEKVNSFKTTCNMSRPRHTERESDEDSGGEFEEFDGYMPVEPGFERSPS